MEELEELKKEIKEVLEKVNKKLEDENKYWTVDYWGEIIYDTDDGTEVDKFKKEIGNYFKTEEEGKEHLEDLKIKTEIKKIAKELNRNRKINWDDHDQTKYSLTYDYDDSEVKYDYNLNLRTEGTIYCLHPNFMKVCIKRIGKERLKNYLKRR